MVSKGFPNVVTEGQQYNIEEKPTVILYTYIINSPRRDSTKTTIKEHSKTRCTIYLD